MINNQIKTVFILGLLTGLLLWVGNLVGGMSGLTIALIFAIIFNFGSYWFSDKIVLAMYKAQPVTEKEHPDIFKMVREIVHLANMPMPKIYLIPSENPNAFATGRNPENAAIAFTTGIINLLNNSELKGVTAHELSHVKNRDTLVTTIAATMAGVISYVAMMARWAAIFGGMRGDRDNNGLIEFLALAIVTPLMATLLQLSLSRSREYLADETGAKMLHNAHGLASALEKLKSGNKIHPMRFGSEATSALFINNPFSGKNIMKLLSTHPPLDDRIKKLKEMNV